MPDDVSLIETLAKRVAQLESENEALRFEADDLDGQVAELEDEVQRLSIESADDERDQQVAELEVEVESLRDENAELETQLAASEATFSSNGEGGSGLGSDEERVYLASKNRRHFHRPACKWATYIPEYLLIEFGSHAEAVEAGYKPCKTCRA
jgi:chromosome segregation ATPase